MSDGSTPQRSTHHESRSESVYTHHRLDLVVKTPADAELAMSEVEKAIESTPWFHVEEIGVADDE